MSGASTSFLRLVNTTQWGTNGPRWVVEGLADELLRIPNLQTLELTNHAGELLGGYALAPKRVQIGPVEVAGVHRMSLVVRPELGGQGLGKLLVSTARRHFLDQASEPTVVYGYVEDLNLRSMKVTSGAGYTPAGSFRSSLFSRMSPCEVPNVRRARPEDDLLPLLQAHYKDHALVDLALSYDPDNTWVLEEQGVVLASMAVKPKRWRMSHLGGRFGGALLQVLPRVPYLRRLMPAGVFAHLQLTQVYTRLGQEAAFYSLLEGVLSATEQHVALWFNDPGCTSAQRILSAGSHGMIESFDDGEMARVMVGTKGFSEALTLDLRLRPVLVSPLDPT